MDELSFTILTWLLGVLGTIITSFLLPMLFKYLSAKADNEKLSYVIDEMGKTVIDAVDCVQQTFVDQLKADGKFDKEKQEEALSKAVKYAIDSLSSKTKEILSKDGIDLESLIAEKIEAYISSQKNNKNQATLCA